MIVYIHGFNSSPASSKAGVIFSDFAHYLDTVLAFAGM